MSLILECSDFSIGVENDIIEGFSDWTGQVSFTFINTRHESWYIQRMTLLRDILTELAKFLLLSSIQVTNLSTFSFVNGCGRWHYWGTFWLDWPNFFYFHLYKSWILVHSALSIGVEDDTIDGHSDWTCQISFTYKDVRGWKCLKNGGGTMDSKIPYSHIPPGNILGGLWTRNMVINIPPSGGLWIAYLLTSHPPKGGTMNNPTHKNNYIQLVLCKLSINPTKV